MVKAKGKAAAKHALTRVYGYTKSGNAGVVHLVGGRSGKGVTARRHNKPKHSGQYFFT